MDVLNTWKVFAESLGKDTLEHPDCGDPSTTNRYDDEFARSVLLTLRDACFDANGSIPELDAAIDWEEVHSAIRSLCNGKKPGSDNVSNEWLRNGGIALELSLVQLFNHIWNHNDWPSDWQYAILLPLYKGDGLRTDPRATTVCSL